MNEQEELEGIIDSQRNYVEVDDGDCEVVIHSDKLAQAILRAGYRRLEPLDVFALTQFLATIPGHSYLETATRICSHFGVRKADWEGEDVVILGKKGGLGWDSCNEVGRITLGDIKLPKEMIGKTIKVQIFIEGGK